MNVHNNPIPQQWRELGSGYRRLMSDPSESSTYLREVGLKPTVMRLLGDCSEKRVLDVGAGGGWLFEKVVVGEGVACDLAPADAAGKGVDIRDADAAALPYPDEDFDTVVSNLMLCYCADIAAPLREMARVARPGGQLLVSLVHPYFYRTGPARDDGSFLVTMDLSKSQPLDIVIGNRVGPFQYFFHPYPDYLNAAVGAGWEIETVEDWFFNAEEYRKHFPNGDTVARSERVPVFTFFSCVKRG